MDKINKEVQKYIDVLQGKRCKGYFGKNLIILDDSAQSIEERTKDDISSPLNYNREYAEPKPKTKSKSGNSKSKVDPELMCELFKR